MDAVAEIWHRMCHYFCKGFCYFCPVKSKTLLTGYLLKFCTISAAVSLLKYPTQKNHLTVAF